MLNLPYSSKTIAILRSGYLSPGCEFVRCKAPSAGAAMAAAAEIAEPGVFLAWHPDFGDYLRVDRGTRAFAAICAMAS